MDNESYQIANWTNSSIYSPQSVFHCFLAQQAADDDIKSKSKVLFCKPELSNGRQDRVRIVIVRTKLGICKINEYVSERYNLTFWSCKDNTKSTA